jgi:hypothetical protein
MKDVILASRSLRKKNLKIILAIFHILPEAHAPFDLSHSVYRLFSCSHRSFSRLTRAARRRNDPVGMGSACPKNLRVLTHKTRTDGASPSGQKNTDLPSLGFLENQETIEEVLVSHSSEVELDRFLQKRYLSFRAVVREIRPDLPPFNL